MSNDNDAPFENLDLDSLFNVRQWFTEAVEAKGAKVTGAGIGVKGDLGMADIDVEIDGFRFNLEIAPRRPCGECHLKSGERCDICGKQAVS